MPLPARDKTFALENCRDVLRKLEWEYKTYQHLATSDPEPLAYTAFNAAVTAWHVGDWVWEDMGDEQKAALREEWGLELKSKGAFQTALREREPSLNVCREIATASKHVLVTQHSDDGVATSTSAAEAKVVTSSGDTITADKGQIVTAPSWSLDVELGDDAVPFGTVLERALGFWTEFIYQRGIAK